MDDLAKVNPSYFILELLRGVQVNTPKAVETFGKGIFYRVPLEKPQENSCHLFIKLRNFNRRQYLSRD